MSYASSWRVTPPPPPPPPPPDSVGAPAPPPPPSEQQGDSAMTNGPTGAPAGQSNGPVASEATTDRSDPTPSGPSWERAWTLEELRKGSTNWSLASDAGLLLHLREFSQRMISRTHEMGKQVDGLMHDMKATDTRVHNVFNNFLMLANTQFVENRVYDEDISEEAKSKSEEEEKKTDQEKTREQREAELVPKVTEALGYGLGVIDNAFETLDIKAGQSDSEDEETGYKAEPILEPKDPYVHRPLPCIIGSQAFLEDDEVGLGDVASEDEEVVSGHGSVSNSESDRDLSESESEEYSESEEEESGSEEEERPKKANTRPKMDDSEEEGDLFGAPSDKEDEEEEEQEDESQERGAFAAELTSKIGAAFPTPDTAEDDDFDEEKQQKKEERRERTESTSSKGSKKGKKEKKSKSKKKTEAKKEDDLFGPPPMEDDEDSPFGGKGLFSGGRGLFDDEPSVSGGGLFQDDVMKRSVDPEPEPEPEPKPSSTKREPTRTRKQKKLSAGLFSGDDDDLFASSPPKETKQPGVPKVPSSGGLFEEEDDDGDLFSMGGATKPPPLKKEEPKPRPKGGFDLFGEDEEEGGELFGGSAAPKPTASEEKKQEESPKKKLPPGAVSMFGTGTNPLAAAIAARRKHSTDEESEQEEEEKEQDTKPQKPSQAEKKESLFQPPPLIEQPKPKKTGMFFDDDDDDDEEDDLFGSLPAKGTTGKSQATSQAKPQPKKPAGGLSLFSDEEEAAEPFVSTAPTAKQPEETPEPKQAVDSKPGTSSLFEDEGTEDDLFTAGTKPTDTGKKKKPVGGKHLFGGTDIFGDAEAGKEETEAHKPTPEKPKQVSMFDEDEQDDDSASTQSKASQGSTDSSSRSTPARRPAGTRGLFGGDDDDDEGDGGLFSSPAASKPSKPVKPAKQAKSLFADEDVLFGGQEEIPDVDLFKSSSSPKPAPKTEVEERPSAQMVKVKSAVSLTKPADGDLFGDDDDNDLFSSGPTKKQEPPSEPEAVSEPPPLPEEKKPKKLAGAVSMFGGMDPSALLKKKEPAQKKEVTVDPLLGELSSSSPPSEDPSPSTEEKAPSQPAGFTSVRPPKGRQASSAIGKLQASLAINPSAMLPGAAPPVKEPEAVPISFDQPFQTKTLESLSKDRAKIQTKRRLPSRRGRRAGPGQVTDSVTSPDSSTKASSSLLQPATTANLFGNDSLADKGDFLPKEDPIIVTMATSNDETDTMDDIFSSSKSLTKPAVSKALLDDDLFGSAPAASGVTRGSAQSADDLFSTTKQTAQVEKAPTRTKDTSADSKRAESSGDSLFSAAATEPVEVQKSKDQSTAVKKSGKLGEMPEDDIFATEASGTKSKPKKYKAVTPESSLFSDDTNIFADIPAAKPNEKKKKTVKATSKSKGLFKDEPVDDIFADAGSSAPKKSKPKKKTAKKTEPQGNIFEDDTTDIFADPLNVLKK